jgi:hypothetical protein
LSHRADLVSGLPAAHDMMLEPDWRAEADSILGWLGQRGL